MVSARRRTWAGRNRGMLNDYLPDPEAEWGHDPHLVTLCAAQPDRLWQQNHSGVFTSEDGAQSWKRVSQKDAGVHFGFPIAADRKDAKTAWVVPLRGDQERMTLDNGLFVARTGDGGATWQSFREGLPQDYVRSQIVHQGMIGVFDNRLRQVNYHAADKHARDRVRGRVGDDERIEEEQAQGGWLGITDHYWLTAVVLDQSERISAYFDSRTDDGTNNYRSAYRGQWREAPAGGEITYTQRFYAGAKEVELLQAYQNSETTQPIPRFDDAIDWGNFWFLTRPFFLWLLHPLGQMVGNFGIAILLSTIVIKALMFPLVYQSFKAMAKMRALQPKMKELQERFAADKQRQSERKRGRQRVRDAD